MVTNSKRTSLDPGPSGLVEEENEHNREDRPYPNTGKTTPSRGGRRGSTRNFRTFFDAFGFPALAVLSGIGMVVGVHHLPGPTLGDITTIGIGTIFAVLLVLLLVTRLRRIYAGHRFWLELATAVGALVVMLAAFSYAFSTIGILNSVDPSSPQLTHNYARSLYFTLITFTTTGYGDFHPADVGRGLACVLSLTGYFILALIASTAAGLIQAAAKRSASKDENESATDVLYHGAV